jgi:hypothetical protein
MDTDKECLRAVLEALLNCEETRERLLTVMRQDLLRALEPSSYLRGYIHKMAVAHDSFCKYLVDNDLLKHYGTGKMPKEVHEDLMQGYNARHGLIRIWDDFEKSMNKYGLLEDEDA